MAIKRTPKKRKQGKPRIRNRFLRWGVRLLVYFFAITIGWVIVLRFVNPPITWLMVQRAIERKSDGKDWKITKRWVNYEDLSDNLKRAAISGEDAHFMTHSGFDREAIKEALERNKSGGTLRGGSTISQQTAKNVFLWPGRGWIRKGLEAGYTVLIETIWPKRRIMEVYLNVAEWAPGVYGAEAAARYWFRKSAADLTPSEAARLAAILPSPRRYQAASPGPYVRRRAGRVQAAMSTVRNDGLANCVLN